MVRTYRMVTQSKTDTKLIDAHGHAIGSHAAHGPEGNTEKADQSSPTSDVEVNAERSNVFDQSLLTQLIGVGILEFGVVLHR